MTWPQLGILFDILLIVAIVVLAKLSPRFSKTLGKAVAGEVGEQIEAALTPIRKDLAELREHVIGSPTEIKDELDRTPVLSLAQQREDRRN